MKVGDYVRLRQGTKVWQADKIYQAKSGAREVRIRCLEKPSRTRWFPVDRLVKLDPPPPCFERVDPGQVENTQDACTLAIIMLVVCPPGVDREILRRVAEKLADELEPPARDRAFSRAADELLIFTERAARGDYGPVGDLDA